LQIKIFQILFNGVNTLANHEPVASFFVIASQLMRFCRASARQVLNFGIYIWLYFAEIKVLRTKWAGSYILTY